MDVYRSTTVCLLLLFQLLYPACSTTQECLTNHASNKLPSVDGRMNVLLLTLPISGNLAPLLALGEELVRRGHNVTLSTTTRTEQGFANGTMMQAEKVGVAYNSAGDSIIKMKEIAVGSKDVFSIISSFIQVMPQEQKVLMKSVHDYLSHNRVDIILSTELLQPVMACIDSTYNVPVVALGTSLQYQVYTHPQWPWPGALSGVTSDDLTFLQRIRNVAEYYVGSLVFKYGMIGIVMNSIQNYCPDAGLSYASSATGVYFPHIVQSVIGFEYPRTITPLTSYVGPILSKSPEPLSNDLKKWLDKKSDQEVIYISMGSILVLSREEILTILNAVMATRYSAVWALRGKTEDVLAGVSIDQNRIYITEWAPQLSVMGHGSVGMAVLHGGSNGLHEALFNEIPPIVLPIDGDQFANAGRILYHGLGIHIPASNVSKASLVDAIKLMERDGDYYRSNVAHLKRRFTAAGGVERAAELVELYAAVGYDELIPAYAKYNWSWVKYYNLDVHLIIVLIIVMVTGTLAVCCRGMCTKVYTYCSESRKRKAD